MTSTLGVVLVVAAAIWMWGGVVLRVGGALMFFVGVAGLIGVTGVDGFVPILFGSVMWFLGQLHHRLRHGTVKSPHARTLFGEVEGRRGGRPTLRRQCDP